MHFQTIENHTQPSLSPVTGLIAHVGTACFFPRLQLVLEEITTHCAFVWRRGETSGELLTGSPNDNRQSLGLAYCGALRKNSPHHIKHLGDLPEGLTTLCHKASDPREEHGRKAWMMAHGCRADLSISLKARSGTMTLTALARDDEAFEATAVVSDLVGFASLVLPLVQLHIRLTETDTSPAACASGMEQRLAGMFPELTSRERQVCARSIIGMTAEGIALDLGIKQTSVLTYRRRAYARLNICSINQLSSMLIQSGTPLASAA